MIEVRKLAGQGVSTYIVFVLRCRLREATRLSVVDKIVHYFPVFFMYANKDLSCEVVVVS